MAEEIIINGVDVSGCEYYNKDDKTCREVNGNYDTDICEFDKCENSNCYYKQLKRKERECEELKHKVELMMDCASCKIDEYKQTLTEIKEIAEILAPMTDEYEDCYDKDRCFECEFTDICKYFNIKQILQKIREVEG